MSCPIQTTGDTSWFTHDRFGLFIHWGLYALPARHEWVKSKEQLGDDVYDKYFKYFDPDLYEPEVWADAAEYAGMKYFVITTKHHEGFCLWDSKLTDYKSTNTPAGRDLLRPMVDAFRSRNLRTGFYHSIIDWHHPHYVVDHPFHPQRNSEDFEKLNVGRDQMKYADYLHGQVRELLTEFGDVDVLWFDFSYGDEDQEPKFTHGKRRQAWRSEELYKMIRELQPGIVLNDRLDLEDPSTWDIKTPEQFQPREWVTVKGERVVWEACQTFSGSWGYHRDEMSWRSTEQLLLTLIDCVSKGGNLLMNVGPTGRGEFDERALDRLQGMGDWMHYHSRSIYGCTEAPQAFKTPQDCRLTYNPEKKRLYIHMIGWPYKALDLEGQAYVDRIDYAQFLHDASQVKVRPQRKRSEHENLMGNQGQDDVVTLVLPQTKPNVTYPVIELMLK